MENIFKPRGTLKSQKPDSGGAVLRTLPMLGIVKDNVDPVRSGRIRVFISALGAKDPDNEENWTSILYLTPFYGMTDPSGGKTGYGSYKNNPISYGMWNSPPDIGTTVICLFINGDPNFGFYIGSVPDAEAMRMIPAMGANFDKEKVIFDSGEAEKYGGATRVPVTNMNTNDSSKADSSNFLLTPKPVHSFQASIMFQQGILRDRIRGPISSSSQRESPSRVGWGVSTPGRPIYEGGFTDETIADAATNAQQQSGLKIISRRGGHSFVMDDGDLIGQDNLVRIRTSLGHQILMSDDGQTLMLLHSNGQSYIELGKEGTVDVYSTNSINLRTQGDLNLHADNDININAAKKLNIQANEININSETTIKQKAGTDYNVYTQGIHTNKVDGAMSFSSAGDASFASDSTTYVNGSVINLNTGSTSTTPEQVPPIPIIAQTDTLFSQDKGWLAAPGKLLTIVSRAPAHTPWANAGQGVDVKVNLNEESQFPNSASPEMSSTNEVANTTNDYPAITVSAAATVPPVTPASASLDKSATGALVTAAATQASLGPAKDAIKSGAGVVSDSFGKTTGVAVGITGLTAKALDSAGTIKPGSGDLVNSLVQGGKTIQQAMPSNLFTGQNGATNLSNLVNNTSAQASATVTTFQQTQTALTQAGLMTGKEGPAGIGGAILSGATNGITSTVGAIKNIGAGVNTLTNNIVGSASSVMQSFASGNFATSLSQNVMGGLSGISNAVSSMAKGLTSVVDSAKGVAASAFSSIKSSLKSFEAGIPQDLKAIAEKNQQAQAMSESDMPADPLEGLTQEQLDKLGNADATDPFIRSRLGLPPLGGSSVPISSSMMASGVTNLPGGSQTVASVVNNAKSVLPNVPGTAGVSSLINNAVTATTNNISLNSAVNSANGLVGGSIGSIGGSLDKLKSGSTSLTSLISSGLPVSAASQLNSAISSLSSGGPLEIKIPTVAVNTTDRGSLESSISSLLPAGVPKPNFSGIPTASKTSLETQQENNAENAKKLEDLNKQYAEQQKAIDKAESEFFKAKVQYLPGDPAIQIAKQTWDVEIKKQAELSKQIAQLMGLSFNTNVSPELQQQGEMLNNTGQELEKFLRTNPFTGKIGGSFTGNT